MLLIWIQFAKHIVLREKEKKKVEVQWKMQCMIKGIVACFWHKCIQLCMALFSSIAMSLEKTYSAPLLCIIIPFLIYLLKSVKLKTCYILKLRSKRSLAAWEHLSHFRCAENPDQAASNRTVGGTRQEHEVAT